jgi:hypothetical protein
MTLPSSALVPLPLSKRGAIFTLHEKNFASGKNRERLPGMRGLFASGRCDTTAPEIRTESSPDSGATGVKGRTMGCATRPFAQAKSVIIFRP